MRFLGFDFRKVDLPFGLVYTPAGWNENLVFRVTRSKASVRDWKTASGADKHLRPIAFESTALPATLDPTQVVDSLVAEAKKGVSAAAYGSLTEVAQMPAVLSKRPNVLSYNSMKNVMCAGYMIASFKYEFGNLDEPSELEGYSDKFRFAEDAAVGTAFNLAKTEKTGITVLHSKKEGFKQVHTEQLLCGQLGAFLAKLEEAAGNAAVIDVSGRHSKFKNEKFDTKKMSVDVRIVFEHVQKNVRTDCPACTSTINTTTGAWGPKCKAFSIAVSKNA